MTKQTLDTVLVRMDRIGDLVLSLPVDQHPALAGRRVHWLITQGLDFIVEQSAPKRAATALPRRFSPWVFASLVQWFRRERPQTVVLLHSPWWVSMAAWWANVPERIGRLSQWHSFLFLNLGIQQSRKAADRHESDFNFDLVEWGFNRMGVRRTFNLDAFKRSYLHLIPPNPYSTIEARGLKTHGYRVVHPGMAGSALNWPKDFYRELILQLALEMPVLITGTKADAPFLKGLEELRHQPNVHWLVDQLKTAELLDLLSQARSVVAPSTGVLHLAASLGTPVVGLYSPRRVEHPRRWGPKGAKVSYLVPPVNDAELFTPEVMRQIPPNKVYAQLMQMETEHVRAGKTPPLDH